MIRPPARPAGQATGAQRFPGDDEDAVEVGVDDVKPQLVGDLRGDAAAAASGIVDQNVQRPEPVDDRADQIGDLRPVRDVAGPAVHGEVLFL